MLVDTRCNRKDVRVEDDVFRREPHLFGENVVRPTANFDFTCTGIRLPLFIKGHHHHRRTVATQQFRVVNKGFYPFFHRDGVNDAFTLNAL